MRGCDIWRVYELNPVGSGWGRPTGTGTHISDAGEDVLERISWDESFEKFEENRPEFLYQEHKSSGDGNTFFKLGNRYELTSSPRPIMRVGHSSRAKNCLTYPHHCGAFFNS